MGYQTPIQCIVLDKTCGNAIKLGPHIFSYFADDITVPKKAIIIGCGEIEIVIGMPWPHTNKYRCVVNKMDL